MRRLFAGIALVALAASCGSKSDAQLEADKLKMKAASGLKDPDSAKFRDLRLKSGMLCGEVNAKNSYGAYAGNEQFSAIGQTVQMRNEIASVDAALNGGPKIFDGRTVLEEFDRQWSECHSKGVVVE